jgi:hypothetical protein
MTWLYAVAAGAVTLRWGLWHLRDIVEWIERPRRDRISPAMLARLRPQGNCVPDFGDPGPIMRLLQEGRR